MGRNKNKKSRFGSNVTGDVAHQNKPKSFGYLELPKNIKLFKESKGRVELDIIPYMVTSKKHPDSNPEVKDSAHPGNPWYKRPILVHHGIGAGKDKESLLCPKTNDPKAKCPICEEKDKQFRDSVPAKDVVGKLSPRNLYLVIPKNNKNFDEEIHIWDVAQGNFQAKLNEELEEKPEKGDFPDPECGRTLNIRFSQETFAGNKYCEASRVDFEKRDKQYKESIMKEAPCLDDILKILSYKQLAAKFFQMDEEDMEDDDDGKEEAPKKRKKKTIPKKEENLKKKKSKSGSDDCPDGHKFAKDWDKFDDCDDCKLHKACGKAHSKK